MSRLPRIYRGLDLRAEREMRGISIEEMAQASKYSVRQLRDFEAGHYERLPSDVFIRGIVKMFIECLGLDPAMVHLEYLHHTDRASNRQNTREEQMPVKQNFWTMQVGPVAGFFMLTCLVMVVLWPAKEFEIEGYLPGDSGDVQRTKVDWTSAEECLNTWSKGRINLKNESGLQDNVFTVKQDLRTVKIVTAEANWVRIQDMRTGTERLQGLFPGSSFTFTLHDETIMWFDRPEEITLLNAETDALIHQQPPAVIRFLPVKNPFILDSENHS